MFAELVELGKRIALKAGSHPALGPCTCDHYIFINEQGEFLNLTDSVGKEFQTEYIPNTAKNGKARFLLDNAEYTLSGCDGLCESSITQELLDKNKNAITEDYKNLLSEENRDKVNNDQKTKLSKNEVNYLRYIIKLKEYKHVQELAPVFLFYNNPKEVDKARREYYALQKSKQKGNMTFAISGPLLSLDVVQNAIIERYENCGQHNNSSNKRCAICGRNTHPITEKPHGGVSLPGSDKKCSLVSFNKDSFVSYNLERNLNSGICSDCARNYVEALSYLTSSEWITEKQDNKKDKKIKKYESAFEISDDTLVVFWTKEPDEDVDPFSDAYQPSAERVKKMFNSVATGDYNRVNVDVENYFYSCTISSAAARIAVRDWMAISVSEYKANLCRWFEDIATIKDDEVYYPDIYTILKNCIKKKKKPTQSDFKAQARIGTMLWHATLTNGHLPLIILQSVLNQIEHDQFNVEKSTVIRLVLNRNIKNTYKMKNELDEQNESKAYLCGRLFALICKLQFMSQGDVNSSIQTRFFASASNTPARVFGVLLPKYVPVYLKKAKGAYAKDIGAIAARIGNKFPAKLSVIERGEFALGFYYQYNNKQRSEESIEQ